MPHLRWAALWLSLGLLLLAGFSSAAAAQSAPPGNFTFGDGTNRGTQPVFGLSAGNMVNFQVSVGTSATLLVSARPGRSTVTIINPAAVVLCYGNAGVTVTTGTCLPATVGYARTIAYTGALYAVFASSSATVTGDEVF